MPRVSRLGTLDVWRLTSYGGGIFVPVKDALAGKASGTYGGGRYLLDTAKGADLGAGKAPGWLVLDFNFAYNPSCAYDPAWQCPLAPAGNLLRVDVPVGEVLTCRSSGPRLAPGVRQPVRQPAGQAQPGPPGPAAACRAQSGTSATSSAPKPPSASTAGNAAGIPSGWRDRQHHAPQQRERAECHAARPTALRTPADRRAWSASRRSRPGRRATPRPRPPPRARRRRRAAPRVPSGR